MTAAWVGVVPGCLIRSPIGGSANGVALRVPVGTAVPFSFTRCSAFFDSLPFVSERFEHCIGLHPHFMLSASTVRCMQSVMPAWFIVSCGIWRPNNRQLTNCHNRIKLTTFFVFPSSYHSWAALVESKSRYPWTALCTVRIRRTSASSRSSYGRRFCVHPERDGMEVSGGRGTDLRVPTPIIMDQRTSL